MGGLEPPNVLLVVLDTRAHDLECYGYERETMPALSRFAANVTACERAELETATEAIEPSLAPLEAARSGAEAITDGAIERHLRDPGDT